MILVSRKVDPRLTSQYCPPAVAVVEHRLLLVPVLPSFARAAVWLP